MIDADHDAIIVLQRDVASIKSTVDRLDKSINGNGHPGLKARLDILEAQKNTTIKVIGSIVALTNVLLALLTYFNR